MRRTGHRKKASKPSGGRSLFSWSTAICVSRCEIFDEADLDAALARFEELHPQTPRLENAASQVSERFLERFAARDWDAMAEMLADDFFIDDRRPVVSAGVLDGRDAEIANMSAIAELLCTEAALTVVATRGGALPSCAWLLGPRSGPDAFHIEVLGVVEINADERIAAFVVSNPTTSTPPSRSSMPGTSPAKRPPTHIRGRLSHRLTPRSTDTNFPRMTGPRSITGALPRSNPAP